MENIMVIGEKKKHLKQIIDTIHKQSNHEVTVKSFTKTSDLNETYAYDPGTYSLAATRSIGVSITTDGSYVDGTHPEIMVTVYMEY